MLERMQEKTRTSLWDKILRGDIKKQADFVEFLGIAGLILFVVLVCVLWTTKIDITVPTHEARVIDDISGGILIKAEVLDSYASLIKEGQEAQVTLVFADNTKIKTIGTIMGIEEGSKNIPLTIIVKSSPDSESHGILKEWPKNIHMRIIVEKKRFISLFIQKMSTRGNHAAE